MRSIGGQELSHSPAMTAHRECCSTKDPAQSPGTRKLLLLLLWSELIPQPRWVVHAKKRGGFPMDVTFSFHKGSEGRDTVPDEVVGLAKDVQINLRHFWLQADNLELQRNKESR